MELLRGAAGSLRFPEYGGDPVALDALPDLVVRRHSDGSPVATGPVTEEGAGEEAFYAATVDSTATLEVDLLVAEWTGTVGGASSSYTTYAEVVGGHLAPLKGIARKYDGTATDEELSAAREDASAQIEAACGVAFRARYARQVLDGDGGDTVKTAPRLLRVLAATLDGESLDPAELTVDPDGFLIRSSNWTAGRGNVDLAYVHGYEHFPAAGLPVVDLAAYLLTQAPTDWNARATAHTTADGNTYTLVTPGLRGASFPLPSVNAFVEGNEFPDIY